MNIVDELSLSDNEEYVHIVPTTFKHQETFQVVKDSAYNNVSIR